jgi:hypothetical protein
VRCSPSGGGAATGSNCYIGMGKVFVFITRFWSVAAFPGRRLPMALRG